MPSLDAESLALLQLNLTSGIGPRLQSLLLARFGTAQAIFAASGSEILQVDGIGPKASAAIVSGRNLSDAQEEWNRCCETNTKIIFRHAKDYPPSLNETSDPPPVLYIRGDVLEQDLMAVAIVGSRQCTHYGRTIAHSLANQLARAGVTVVSGLARGIDAAAHRGAIEAQGRTFAVCAPGLAHIYPAEHKQLAEEVTQQGALITESPLDRSAQRGLFPQRNRIIAGLSLGVIIVEATRTSGSLHTARHAMEQGRDVFAVPGRIDTVSSEGCHDLIRDGAVLVRRVEDILDALSPALRPVKTNPQTVVAVARELNLNDQERTVLNLVDFSATSIDAVLNRAEMEASRVLSTLTVLEMKRLVRRLPGGNVERVTG
ncbi:DNA-processing protein DprA [Planctomicrobium piriforme]|uniref:DNA processing protein n=1 Tax=Planctomicrobium piriforme TaxID=1576369 RepID=A0A1I3D6E7_9PLAN|nr:DNA-processing protein DprA [Planctomicrobium piriforme]SFH82285.1 DNA processing protein [Planctomicrobium piriforme]